jgi:type IV secretion system protein VirD4
MSLFFQEDIRRRCVPGPPPATDIADVISQGGTIYLLGREDPYASASPLMTAVAEHVLDTALQAANTSPWGRLCPPDARLPRRAALHRTAAHPAHPHGQRTRPGDLVHLGRPGPAQLTQIFGEQEARTLVGLTNNLIVFGGSKDVAFNQEISDLLGPVRVSRVGWQTGQMGGRQVTATTSHPDRC